MKKIRILFILLAMAISLPCYSQEISVKKLAEFEIYQGSFDLTEDGFMSVSDRNILTYYIWDKEQNNFRETENTSQKIYLELPEYNSRDDEETRYTIHIKRPQKDENPIIVNLVILPPKGKPHPRWGFGPNRDFYIELLLDGREKIFQSERLNGVVKKFLREDMTKDSDEEIVLEYESIGGSGATASLVVFKLEPEVQR